MHRTLAVITYYTICNRFGAVLSVSGLTTVSGGELELALSLGVAGGDIVYNGNGKTSSEIIKAIASDCLINIDSQFDFERICAACQRVGRQGRVLIRINPDIDPNVHEYNTTAAGAKCKFGVLANHVVEMAHQVAQSKEKVQILAPRA